MANGAICDLLEHEPVNKEVADKIKDDCCPDCNAEGIVRWCPGNNMHDLCTHFHCMKCDADYCWPIAWEPPLPVIKMKGKLSPYDRRAITEICKRHDIAVPDWWKPIMESDLEAKNEHVVLHCYECKKEKAIEVIFQAGSWHWKRGGYARGWVDTDNEIVYEEKRHAHILWARCNDCYQKVLK